MLAKGQEGHDGQAPYERPFGKPCCEESLEFGELVRYLTRPGDWGAQLERLLGAGGLAPSQRGAAARAVAPHADEVRELRAVSRVPEADK
eukprot:3895966-Alexandrium_andersonii.AAC.1